MSRLLRVVVLIAATGCAGRWMGVEQQPIHPSPTRQPRDYRVVLRTDSVVVLHNAVVRDDSLVELPSEASAGQAEPGPRGVALSDVVRMDQWQPKGERITGGVVLGVLAILGTVGYFIFRGFSGPGS